jgi:hypothetical protein
MAAGRSVVSGDAGGYFPGIQGGEEMCAQT